ncbi:hypothetical protein [Gulbenkiania indica]|uniref:hypothetical protein n=1 Tax=Gulbenkiania indica TaxID=375574 RepID=UPI0012E27B6D|nr:hypothetical protein [Gulbenkiania indica]
MLGNDDILIAITQPAGKDEPGEEVWGRLCMWMTYVFSQLTGLPIVSDKPLADLHSEGNRRKLSLPKPLAILQELDGLKVLDTARVC